MPLVQKDEVLKLADGTIVHPDGSTTNPNKRPRIEIPSNSSAQRTVTRAARRLADLPALPMALNTISIVLVYSLWGLSETDIAVATNLTEQQVTNIKSQDAYSKMQSEMIDNIRKSDEDNVRALINEHANTAVTNVVNLMSSEDDKISLAASKDILDRAGHRPADIVEHRHSMVDPLRIEIVRKDGSSANAIPMIDITPQGNA